ncbi:MAG: TRAP transporter small permease [Alphaproteobacteria bacterium]|nr:TRAP transporter small permease [Alphaproteobacteria bacterium]
MVEALFRLHRTAVGASRRLSWVAVCVLLLVSLVVTADVTLRWLLDSPVHGLEDLTALAILVAVIACFPAGFALNTNITVRFVGRALGRRGHSMLETFGHLVTLVFALALAWQLWIYAGDLGNRTTFILQIGIQPAWYATMGFAALAAAMQGLVFLCHLIAWATGHEPPGDGGGHVL